VAVASGVAGQAAAPPRVLPIGPADRRRRRSLAHHGRTLARMALAGLAQAGLPQVRPGLRRGPPPEHADALASLRRDGAAVLAGFFSADECARLRAALDELLDRHAGAIDVDVWQADHRLFLHPDLAGPLGAVARDPRLRALAEAALGGPVVNGGLLMARLEARPGNLGSGAGWHRDSFLSQVKTLVYLDAVDEAGGPFQYLLGSQRLGAMLRDRRRAGLGWRQRRLDAAAVERLLRDEPQRLLSVTGGAGTLVLADTTGIHRGKPIERGTRRALTNYFYPRWQVDAALLAHLRPMLVAAA
jgi:hypothetical protein